MKKMTLKFMQIREMLAAEEGQDLIEYALVVALIAFAATVGMNSLASGINDAFAKIGVALSGISVTT